MEKLTARKIIPSTMIITFSISLIVFNLNVASGQSVYEAPSSLCHAEGQAYQCMPPFTNIVEGVNSVATSTCGHPTAQRMCRTRTDYNGGQRTSCQVCDTSNPRSAHSASLLTDRHVATNQTCWMSGRAQPGGLDKAVNLTISLGKKFEVYYISLQPCGVLPESIAIFKSADFGQTWQPWQYFSTDCYRAFRLPTTNEHNSHITSANIQEVLCVALKPPDASKYGSGDQSDSVIAFSTTIGRPSAQPWSASLVDWMTMTDLRISLMRFPTTPDPMSDYSMPPALNEYFRRAPISQRTGRDNVVFNAAPGPGATLSDTDYYAFADLAVGGRCKCNGHANRCLREGGKLRCDCQHNTDGVDCERCKESFVDRPWARATSRSANVCKKCECNLHTGQCRFSQELYLMSGGLSGGICERCKHHTAGRHCHYCQDGYYRDWTKPLGHEMACMACQCHPIGSAVRNYCDKKNGQCKCKEGVTGLRCDRCTDGYKQTRSPLEPCTKIYGYPPRTVPDPEPMLDFDTQQPVAMAHAQDARCQQCGTRQKRIRFKKFCRKEVIFQATMQSREIHGDHVRFEMRINQVWRIDSNAWNLVPERSASSGRQMVPLWIKFEELRCGCPQLQLGISYLIISNAKTHSYRGRQELLINSRSIVLPWREAWKRRLVKFKRRDKRGTCDKFRRRAKIRKVYRRKDEPAPFQQRRLDGYEEQRQRQRQQRLQYNGYPEISLNREDNYTVFDYEDQLINNPYRS